MFNTQSIEDMVNDPRWLGFGYLGERRNLREAVASGERPKTALALLDKADASVLARMNWYGFTAEEFFAWANSINGRKFGDCWFGNNGAFADSYLPTDFAR